MIGGGGIRKDISEKDINQLIVSISQKKINNIVILLINFMCSNVDSNLSPKKPRSSPTEYQYLIDFLLGSSISDQKALDYIRKLLLEFSSEFA